MLEECIFSDGVLEAGEFEIGFAEALRDAGPWGQAFPEPLFDGEFELVEKKRVGERHLKMRLRDASSGKMLESIAFNQTDEQWPGKVDRVQLAYRLDINEFRGRRSLQLLAEYVCPVEQAG